MWIAGCIAALGFTWVLWGELQGGASTVASYTGDFLDVAVRLLVVLSRSALFYIYAGAFGAYLLVRVLRRFRIRFV